MTTTCPWYDSIGIHDNFRVFFVWFQAETIRKRRANTCDGNSLKRSTNEGIKEVNRGGIVSICGGSARAYIIITKDTGTNGISCSLSHSISNKTCKKCGKLSTSWVIEVIIEAIQHRLRIKNRIKNRECATYLYRGRQHQGKWSWQNRKSVQLAPDPPSPDPHIQLSQANSAGGTASIPRPNKIPCFHTVRPLLAYSWSSAPGREMFRLGFGRDYEVHRLCGDLFAKSSGCSTRIKHTAGLQNRVWLESW